MRPPGLELRGVTKRLGGRDVLDGVDLEVEAGGSLTLVGPSGAGKTTLLRIAAGLSREDAGRVAIGGEVVAEGARFVPPRARGIGVVFQDLALFPHMSALENVRFALGGAGLPRAERTVRAEEALERAGAKGLGARRPGELSRGEAQRVALARAIAARPRLLLLDEPFAHLDPALRERLRASIDALRRELGFTVFAAAHLAGDFQGAEERVAVLVEGRIAQVGRAAEIYARPGTRAVAELTGPVSFITTGGRRRLAVRPEQLAVVAGAGTLRARVVERGLAGGRPVVRFVAEGTGETLLAAVEPMDLAPGASVALEVRGEPGEIGE